MVFFKNIFLVILLVKMKFFIKEILDYIDFSDLGNSWWDITEAYNLLNNISKIDLIFIDNLFPAALILKDEKFINANFKNFSRKCYQYDGK